MCVCIYVFVCVSVWVCLRVGAVAYLYGCVCLCVRMHAFVCKCLQVCARVVRVRAGVWVCFRWDVRVPRLTKWMRDSLFVFCLSAFICTRKCFYTHPFFRKLLSVTHTNIPHAMHMLNVTAWSVWPGQQRGQACSGACGGRSGFTHAHAHACTHTNTNTHIHTHKHSHNFTLTNIHTHIQTHA